MLRMGSPIGYFLLLVMVDMLSLLAIIVFRTKLNIKGGQCSVYLSIFYIYHIYPRCISRGDVGA
jgi:hypothetical protein